jgi:multidrug transporter EmrE-like cation transporter
MTLVYYGIAGCSIVLTGLAQVLLKTGASKKSRDGHIYLNRFTLSGYSILFVVTFLSVYALQGIALKTFYAAAYSLAIVIVTILSRFFLRERLSPDKVTGIFLILIGIIVFNL